MAVEVMLVIFPVEMLVVSFNCSPLVDWKVSRLTGVVNSESECLISPVPRPPSSIVPVKFLHDER